jgi:hypothetical protein
VGEEEGESWSPDSAGESWVPREGLEPRRRFTISRKQATAQGFSQAQLQEMLPPAAMTTSALHLCCPAGQAGSGAEAKFLKVTPFECCFA